jgi:hypothetical protein
MDLSFLTDWLLSGLTWLAETLIGGLITITNAIIEGLAWLGAMAIGMLPDAEPLVAPGGIEVSWIGYLNWFAPFGHMVTSIAWYASVVALYFAVAPLLRWAKMVR